MRNRLIELIDQKQVYGIDQYQPESHNTYLLDNDELADHLLENGVIVLLCKVGDTVYQTDGIRIYELEIFDVSLQKYKPYYETESIDFDDTAIGESIFLTREEAEKALAERNER